MQQTPPKQHHPWVPDKPVSQGALAYHTAVVDAEYYVEVLKEYVRLAKEQIKENDIVVEFGAGTGVSAHHMLKAVKVNFKLWLVDNSAAWLGAAYNLFKDNPNVSCYLLEKIEGRYAMLSETIGEGVADKVFSANTVHLIPDIEPVFKGVHQALKPNGNFTFESGNIHREGREDDVLLVDDTVARVHDIALEIVKTDNRFMNYRNDLHERILQQKKQRSFVFPKPRTLDFYLSQLKSVGLSCLSTGYKQIKFKYVDWLAFLRVKRLQAGILPEIGGKEPSQKEEEDRDILITEAAKKLFEDLQKNNTLADDIGFTSEVVYVVAQK